VNIFSRCWSHRRAPVDPPPQHEAIRIVIERVPDALPQAQAAQASVAAAFDDDGVGAPAPALRAALDEVQPDAEAAADEVQPDAEAALDEDPPDAEAALPAPSKCESLCTCIRWALGIARRDLLAMIPSNGSALVFRAGLSMAETPAQRVTAAAAAMVGTATLVGSHWPETARLLLEGGRLQQSSIAHRALTALPFLLELTAVLAPSFQAYDRDDSWDIAQATLHLVVGSRLANFVRDNVTQAQQGYWASLRLVTQDGLDTTRDESDRWRQARVTLQTLSYTALSLAGTLWFAEWFEDRAGIPSEGERYDQRIAQTSPRLVTSVLVETLDPIFIGLSAFLAAWYTGLRIRLEPGEHNNMLTALRANVLSPEGRAATRERVVLNTGMRMGLQSAVDVGNGVTTRFSAREGGRLPTARIVASVMNGLTEPRGYLVERCTRAMTESATARGHSAVVAQARRNAEVTMNGAMDWVQGELLARDLPPTRENIAMLFAERLRRPAAQLPDSKARERTLFTGDIAVVPDGPAAFSRGL